MKIQEPRPLRSRPRERVIPPRVDLKKPTGQVFLQDVYIGRNMKGVERGDIKKLLVLEVLPKPVNFNILQDTITMGGSFTLEHILGTVPVEADGSASFELPALRSLFFVALDENDMAVKRMQSFMAVQPGEDLSCVGCHEHRPNAPATFKPTMAMQRAPSKIEPIKDIPYVFDFPRDIQPILDKHCVPCHDYDKTPLGGPRSGGVILTGDRGRWYSHSYVNLTQRKQFADGRNADGNRAARTIGSSASPLLDILDGRHGKVKVDIEASAHEKKMVKLWIESAATYPGTYAALGTGTVGNNKAGAANVYQVFAKRCTKCHKIPWFDNETSTNLSRPEKSYMLLRPLARDAGGYGMLKKMALRQNLWVN